MPSRDSKKVPRRSAGLVSFHIERVSARAFRDHSAELRELLDSQSGIYALYRDGRLYYVGLAENLFRRINQHRKDKHRHKWDRFSAYVTRRDRDIRELEALTLRIATPRGNRQIGRLTGSENLATELRRAMREAGDLEHARVFSGRIEKRARRKVARELTGPDRLSVLSGRYRRLWGCRNGVDYKAALLASGEIKFAGEIYRSPSGAARAALGRKENGWTFWHFSTGKGEWLPLRTLR